MYIKQLKSNYDIIMMQICTEFIQNKCHDHHLLKKVVKQSCSKIDRDLKYQGQFFLVHHILFIIRTKLVIGTTD